MVSSEKISLDYNSEMNKGVLVFIYIFLTLTLLIPIWIVKYFPSQNGPEYLLFVHMLKEFNNPEFNYSDYYEPIFLVVPNLLYHIFVYLISFVMPLALASKVTLSICVMIFPLSVFYLIRVMDSRKFLLGFAAFPYVYNHFLPKGYNSFYLSIPLFFFFFGYLIKHMSQLNLKKLIWLSLLAFFLYLSHMFSFLLAIFIAILFVLLKGLGVRPLAKVIGIFIPSSIFFLGYIFYIMNESKNLVGSQNSWIMYRSLKPTFEFFITMYMHSYTYLVALLFLIPLSLIALMIVKKGVGRFDQSELGVNNRPFRIFMKEETMLIMVILLSIIFFILPREILGWGKFNTRLLPFVFLLMVVAAEPFSKKLFNWMFIGINALISLCIVGIISFQVLEVEEKVNDYISGIPFIKKNRTILPVHLEYYQVGKIKPNHWAFNYYNLFKGGATGKSVVMYTGRVPMKYKKPIEEVFPSFDPNTPEEADMTRIKECYHYVLFWGDDENTFTLFESHEFKLIHSQGKLRVYENQSIPDAA